MFADKVKYLKLTKTSIKSGGNDDVPVEDLLEHMAKIEEFEFDPADNYQAYYSMGQVYEIFKFPDFALRFYEQAHRCRPTDSRMLVAMGVIFYQLRRFKDAENAYIKAFRVGDIQGNALKKLAT